MPDHQLPGALCHGLCVGVRKHFISVNYRTNAWVDWPDFYVAHWGWLEKGSAAHPRWPLQPTSWVWFPSIIWQSLGRPVWFFFAYWGWLEEGSFRWPVPPLIQNGRYCSHLGFGFRQLSDERLGRLVQFFCDLLGVTGERFIQHGSHLGFGFRRLYEKHLSRLVIYIL
jgi:hypothetical protein